MSIRKEIKNFIIPKRYRTHDSFDQITVGVINLILPISVILGLGFIVARRDILFNGHKQLYLVYTDIGYVVALGLLYILFIATHRLNQFKQLYCYSGITYFLINYYFAADGEITTLWIFVFTAIIFLLNTFKVALRIFFLFALAVATISILRYEEFNAVFYSAKFMDMFFFSFFLYSIIIIGNEYVRSTLIAKLEVSKSSLKTNNKKLSDALTSLQKTHEQLYQKDIFAKKASQTLSTTINNTKDLIWVINTKGEFDTFNRSFERQVETSFHLDKVPQDLFSILESLNSAGKQLVETWRTRYNSIYEKGERMTYFDKFATEEQIQYFLTDCTPIKENGKIIGISNFSKDITQIRQIKQEKDELIQLNSSIIESLGEIIYNYGIENDRFTWNDATQAVLKMTHEELGYSLNDFLEHFSPKERKVIKEEIDYTLESGINLDVEAMFKNEQLGNTWIHLTGNAIYDHTGKPSRIIGIVWNITDKRAADAKKLQAVVNGIDEERKRIAGEIHDGLGQTLIAASLTLNSLSEKIKESIDEEEFERYAHIEQMINDAIQEGRELSHNLMPKSLEDYGIIPSLRALINKINQTGTLTVEFYTNIDLDTRYHNEIEVCLYRIAQESFNNILKHSGADKVTIQLLNYDNELSLTIEDNGVGFSKIEESGIGIQNIKNRVATIGGNVIIDSHQEYGTLITVELALNQLMI